MSEQPSRDAFHASWGRAQLALIAWLDSRGQPDVATVVPLLDDGTACLALPYAELALARSLDTAAATTLVVPAHRASREAPSVALDVEVSITEDPAGHALEDRDLLPQLIAKHPPDRRRLDSILQRREHWWYRPRLLVRLSAAGPPRRHGPGQATLVVGGDGLEVHPVTPTSLRPLVVDPPPAADGPAVVHAFGADVPDLERVWQRRWRGQLTGGGFVVDCVDGDEPTDRPRSIRERIGVEWRLERACRRGLRAAGHEG